MTQVAMTQVAMTQVATPQVATPQEAVTQEAVTDGASAVDAVDDGDFVTKAPAGPRRRAGVGADVRPRLDTLTAARRYFLGKATPRIIIPLLSATLALRVWVGGWGWRDLLIVVGILAFQPFAEWLIHVYILHFKPRPVGTRTFDLHAARKHREHHGNPNDPDTSFVPLPDLFGLGAVVVAVMWLVSWSVPVFLTGVVTGFAILLTYEWTHYLIHTSYKPNGRYYRYIWRAHRLHHFKNEHYWMGVTVHVADHVFGTFPQKSEVENSPTARTLGVEV